MKSNRQRSLEQFEEFQRGASESGGALAESFKQASRGATANNPEDNFTNSVMSGMAAGMIDSKNAQLRAQMQEHQSRQEGLTKMFKSQDVNIMELSRASMSGDSDSSNKISKEIYLGFKNGLKDPSMGDFSHYREGTIFYHNPETGNIQGRNILGALEQAGVETEEIWGSNTDFVKRGLLPGAKEQYERDAKKATLETEKAKSDLEYTSARISEVNARMAKEAEEEEEGYRKVEGVVEGSIAELRAIQQKGNGAGERSSWFHRGLNHTGISSLGSKTEDVERVIQIGSKLQGALNKIYKYTNSHEFNSIPHPSPEKTMGENIAIVEQLGRLFERDKQNMLAAKAAKASGAATSEPAKAPETNSTGFNQDYSRFQ